MGWHVLSAALLYLWCSSASAMGPFQVYEQALGNDPIYLGAGKERDAGLENRTIGRAGLLPKLNYTYNTGRNTSRASYLDTARGTRHEDRGYNSYGSVLTLQQPLFDYEAYAAYRKGVAQALFADEAFRAKSQELLVRVLGNYTQALFAQDQIDIAQAKKKAYREQFQQNQQLLRQGEGTRTDILEAESRYELAVAEEIAARDELDVTLRELMALTGRSAIDLMELNVLDEGFEPFNVLPDTFDAWQQSAVANSPVLAARRQAVEVAREEVERNRAGHLPKVSAYASINQTESESGNTYNQRYDTNTVGFEISLPLYAGGRVSASTRQASRAMEQAEFELEGKTRETLIELRRQFNACGSGASKLQAYRKAQVSAQALVVATRHSILGGERVNLDLLNAQQQLYNTRRDLARARYDYLIAWVKLRYEAGILHEDDLARVDDAFHPR